MYIVYNATAGNFSLEGNRPNFPNGVILYFSSKTSLQDICHSISYSVLSKGVLDIINGWNDGTILAIECQERLTAIVNSVIIDTSTTIPIKIIINISIRLNLSSLNAELTKATPNNKNVATYSTLLINALNNAIDNLRVGFSSWNRSIQAEFDATEWFHIDSNGTVDASYEGIGISPSGIPPLPHTPDINAFYFYNEYDAYRLIQMINFAKILLSFWTAKAQFSNYYFAYSSSNSFDIPVASICKQRIYFYDYNNSEWVQLTD